MSYPTTSEIITRELNFEPTRRLEEGEYYVYLYPHKLSTPSPTCYYESKFDRFRWNYANVNGAIPNLDGFYGYVLKQPYDQLERNSHGNLKEKHIPLRVEGEELKRYCKPQEMKKKRRTKSKISV